MEEFLEYECNGKIEEIISHLHYNPEMKTLALRGSEIKDNEEID